MTLKSLLFLLLVLIVGYGSVKMKKLTAAGALAGTVLAIFIFLGTGFNGIAMIGLFFLLGTIATAWKRGAKEAMEAGENESGGRTAGQVIANGGVAGLMGMLAWIFPQEQAICRLMTAAALASATADTLSSEIGTVYGKKFYSILNFKPAQRGANGSISMEGTITGIAGSLLIAIAYSIPGGWDQNFALIVIAGTLGNLVDSLLGAKFENKGWLSNNAVNLANTVSAALLAVIIKKLILLS